MTGARSARPQPIAADRSVVLAFSTAPLHPLPEPIADPERIAQLDVRRRDRLGGALHEYRHVA